MQTSGFSRNGIRLKANFSIAPPGRFLQLDFLPFLHYLSFPFTFNLIMSEENLNYLFLEFPFFVKLFLGQNKINQKINYNTYL